MAGVDLHSPRPSFSHPRVRTLVAQESSGYEMMGGPSAHDPHQRYPS